MRALAFVHRSAVVRSACPVVGLDTALLIEPVVQFKYHSADMFLKKACDYLWQQAGKLLYETETIREL